MLVAINSSSRQGFERQVAPKRGANLVACVKLDDAVPPINEKAIRSGFIPALAIGARDLDGVLQRC